jgi:hypothetical protein
VVNEKNTAIATCHHFREVSRIGPSRKSQCEFLVAVGAAKEKGEEAKSDACTSCFQSIIDS